MKIKKIHLAAKASLLFTITLMGMLSLVQGQSSLTNIVAYSTDFNSNSSTGYIYTTNGSGANPQDPLVYVTNRFGAVTQWATQASGQDGWQTSATPGSASNAAGPGTVDYISTLSANPHFLTFGGDNLYSTDIGNSYTYPQAVTNYMIQSAYANVYTNSIHFDTLFWIAADGVTGANANGKYDTLGWTLLNSSGKALVSINLSTTNSDAAGWNLSASSFATDGVTNQVLKKANGTDILPVANNSVFHLGFDIIGIGTAQQSVVVLNYTNLTTTPGGTPTIIGTNLISGYNFSGIDGGTNIAAFADTWILQDTNSFQNYTNGGIVTTGNSDYAFNSLQMANLVIAVPEPKTWILFGLSGLVLVVALRRRASQE